jgi:hypothetical protein
VLSAPSGDWEYIDLENPTPVGPGEWSSVDVVFRDIGGEELFRRTLSEGPMSISRLHAAVRAMERERKAAHGLG